MPRLWRSLVTTNRAGCRSVAITDMSQPLATAAGNALEVIEVMETLTSAVKSEALWDVTVASGGEALFLAGLAANADAGEITEVLASGRAAAAFGEMVALGGPIDLADVIRTGCRRPQSRCWRRRMLSCTTERGGGGAAGG